MTPSAYAQRPATGFGATAAVAAPIASEAAPAKTSACIRNRTVTKSTSVPGRVSLGHVILRFAHGISGPHIRALGIHQNSNAARPTDTVASHLWRRFALTTTGA